MSAPSGQQAEADSRPVVEVRIAASAAQISAVRVVAADLAARQDFDLDAVSDLRMAVDEACTTLVPLAAPASMLVCRFLIGTGSIEVLATVPTTDQVSIPQNTFGWRVLATLADEVETIDLPGEVGIRLCKRVDG